MIVKKILKMGSINFLNKLILKLANDAAKFLVEGWIILYFEIKLKFYMFLGLAMVWAGPSGLGYDFWKLAELNLVSEMVFEVLV